MLVIIRGCIRGRGFRDRCRGRGVGVSLGNRWAVCTGISSIGWGGALRLLLVSGTPDTLLVQGARTPATMAIRQTSPKPHPNTP
jgi:hypothetical protein